MEQLEYSSRDSQALTTWYCSTLKVRGEHLRTTTEHTFSSQITQRKHRQQDRNDSVGYGLVYKKTFVFR